MWPLLSTLHTDIDLIRHLLQFNEGHRSIHKRETVGEFLVNVPDALIEEHDVREIDAPIFVHIVFSSWV